MGTADDIVNIASQHWDLDTYKRQYDHLMEIAQRQQREIRNLRRVVVIAVQLRESLPDHWHGQRETDFDEALASLNEVSDA